MLEVKEKKRKKRGLIDLKSEAAEQDYLLVYNLTGLEFQIKFKSFRRCIQTESMDFHAQVAREILTLK